jgi:endonuclease YncB( thermonuclease family)
VVFINDGDTLRCEDGTRIRLHAVSARERDGSCSPGHPCPSATAGAATAQLSRLAGGKTIRCEPTGHSYNRVTAICWTPEGEEINCAMVRSGVALLWDRFNRQMALCRQA